jgi:hypothetical protein
MRPSLAGVREAGGGAPAEVIAPTGVDGLDGRGDRSVAALLWLRCPA